MSSIIGYRVIQKNIQELLKGDANARCDSIGYLMNGEDLKSVDSTAYDMYYVQKPNFTRMNGRFIKKKL